MARRRVDHGHVVVVVPSTGALPVSGDVAGVDSGVVSRSGAGGTVSPGSSAGTVVVVDGNDPEASYAALSKAIDYVRTERKPYLLEAMVSRLRGHSSASGANLVKGEVDCVTEFENRLEERRLMTRAQIDQLRKQYTQELLEASQKVLEEPMPTPESAFEYVFADRNIVGEES